MKNSSIDLNDLKAENYSKDNEPLNSSYFKYENSKYCDFKSKPFLNADCKVKAKGIFGENNNSISPYQKKQRVDTSKNISMYSYESPINPNKIGNEFIITDLPMKDQHSYLKSAEDKTRKKNVSFNNKEKDSRLLCSEKLSLTSTIKKPLNPANFAHNDDSEYLNSFGREGLEDTNSVDSDSALCITKEFIKNTICNISKPNFRRFREYGSASDRENGNSIAFFEPSFNFYPTNSIQNVNPFLSRTVPFKTPAIPAAGCPKPFLKDVESEAQPPENVDSALPRSKVVSTPYQPDSTPRSPSHSSSSSYSCPSDNSFEDYISTPPRLQKVGVSAPAPVPSAPTSKPPITLLKPSMSSAATNKPVKLVAKTAKGGKGKGKSKPKSKKVTAKVAARADPSLLRPCKFCSLLFTRQGLGGHMSRAHAGQSLEYQKKKATREQREGKLRILRIAQAIYREETEDYEIRGTDMNRTRLNKIRKRIEETIDDPKWDAYLDTEEQLEKLQKESKGSTDRKRDNKGTRKDEQEANEKEEHDQDAISCE